MKKYTVKSISFNDDGSADITMSNPNFNTSLPKSCLLKKSKNNPSKLVLKPGDKFTILYDQAGFEVAYVYSKHLHLRLLPSYPDLFIKSLPMPDKFLFVYYLYGKVLQEHKIPSLLAYKNLQKIIIDRKATEDRLSRTI